MRSATWVKALRVTLRRFARRAFVALGVLTLAALVALISLLVYLQSASGRRLVASKVNAFVSGELTGELRIERIELLSYDRLAVSSATLFDDKGRAVASLSGLRARFELRSILSGTLFEPAIRVEVSSVHIDRLELGLYRTDTGSVSLASALASRPRPLPESPSPNEVGKGPFIHLPAVDIDYVSARTDFADLSAARAELRAAQLNFAWSPETFALGVTTADARVLQALALDLKAQAKAQVRIPGVTDASLDGLLGSIPIQASLRSSEGELALSVSSPSLPPDALRRLLPAWPVREPVSARVELKGRLPALQARVEAQAAASRLEASGSLSLGSDVAGELALTGRELDLRLVAADVPETALGVEGKLVFSLASAPHFELSTRWAKSELLGVPVPETAIVAVYAEKQISGTATTSDPALPVRLDFSVPAQGAPTLRARAQNLDLAALTPYGVRAQGRADFDATANFSAADFDAQGEARIRGLHVAPVLAQTLLARVKVRGALARSEQLAVELDAQGANLALGPSHFDDWSLQSTGELGRQRVTLRAGPKAHPALQVSTTLGFDHGVRASETRLDAELNGVKHELELKSARIASRAVELRDLRWRVGAGSLTGTLLLEPTRKNADFTASGLEADALLKTFSLDPEQLRGRLDAELHFTEVGSERQGSLQARLVAEGVPGLGPVDAQLSANIADGALEGQGNFTLPQLGQGKLSARGTIARAPLSLESLARALGEVRLEVSELDLAAASRRWLPADGVALSGRGHASVQLARWGAGSSATLTYELETRELGLHTQGSNADGTLRYGDITSHGEIGENQVAVQVELKDAAGTWLTAHAEQGVGLSEVLAAFRSSSSKPPWDAPLQAELTAHPRSLELLRADLPGAFNGEVAGGLQVSGSLRHPELKGSLTATGIGTERERSGKLALDFDYSARREEYSVSGRYAERTSTKLEFTSRGHWGWFDHGFGQGWSARGEGQIENIALGPIGDLLGVPLSGQVAGKATLSASPHEFEATGELDLARLALERRPLGDGSARLRVHQGLAEAQLNMVGKGTNLELSGEVGVCWEGGPCVDSRRGGSLDAKVRNYQLATLAPLLRSAISDVRGPISGFVTLAWDPADSAGKRKTRLRADALVTGGSVTLTGGAGSIQCAELRALADNEKTLHLKLSGCAQAKEQNLWAKADVTFDGPVPQHVAGELQVKEVPVSFEGVTFGTATIDPKGKPMLVAVDLSGPRRSIEANIPALDFVLPVKDDTSLVDLSEDPAIVITDEKTAPALLAQKQDSNPWTVSVKLGDRVNIRQPGMRVPVTGALTQGADGLLDGNIILPEGGVVPQLGQIFRLKRGSVRFNHQPLEEGVLNIEAATRTADGVVVELYVSGTLEKPVIRLRSDPPRSENDIVALLLGVQGSDTVTSSGQQGAARSSAATALAMNQLLRGSALAGLQFGAGQTHQGDSVSTVSFRAGNSPVWLEGRTVRSTTQRAANSGVQSSGVIDWRFAQGFSLRTQLGNISGVELRWSHRY
ncbi:MAG TPA: translocation/assembly module TamB domain-containing protein [Polyangiaceae bacterium]|nr:translocation/assembly module TamB domain-containing protein [Polyangiaceae bacterium]